MAKSIHLKMGKKCYGVAPYHFCTLLPYLVHNSHCKTHLYIPLTLIFAMGGQKCFVCLKHFALKALNFVYKQKKQQDRRSGAQGVTE